MNILVGVDLQSIDEVEASMREYGTRYTRRLFTDHELATCGENPTTAASGLAARFAAKEATLKILDTQVVVPSWRSIEVCRLENGRPEIVLHDEAAKLASDQGVNQISLSLSHGGGFAAAVAVAQIGERCNESSR